MTIAGAPYAIATTDSEKYIPFSGQKADEDITKLLDANANLSVTKAAVFCAMDYLDEYHKSAGSAEIIAQPDPGVYCGCGPGKAGGG